MKAIACFFALRAGFEIGYWIGWYQLDKAANHAPAILAATFGGMALMAIIINVFMESDNRGSR